VIQCDSDVPAGNRTAIAVQSEANDGDRWIGRGTECESSSDQSIHQNPKRDQSSAGR